MELVKIHPKATVLPLSLLAPHLLVSLRIQSLLIVQENDSPSLVESLVKETTQIKLNELLTVSAKHLFKTRNRWRQLESAFVLDENRKNGNRGRIDIEIWLRPKSGLRYRAHEIFFR